MVKKFTLFITLGIIFVLCLFLITACAPPKSSDGSGGGGDGNGGDITPGYLTMSFFPFHTGDLCKYRYVSGSKSSTYLKEIDVVSSTATSYVIRHQTPGEVYEEENIIEDNKIITINSNENSLPDGLLPLVLYDLSINVGQSKTINTKSNLLMEDIDDDGLPETISSWVVSQKLLPQETITVENIVFSNCAKIETTISSKVITSTGVRVDITNVVTEWMASEVGVVKSSSVFTFVGPGGTASFTNTKELLKYEVGGITGGDWTPPDITVDADSLTNKLEAQITGITEASALVVATVGSYTDSVDADTDGNYLITVPLEINTSNEVILSAFDFVNNENTSNISVIQDSIPPASVTPSTTLNQDNSVTLNWNASSDINGIAEYRICRNSLPIGRTSGNTWTDTEVNPGEKAFYTVLAVDNAGNVATSTVTSVSVPPGGTGTFNTQFQLTWPVNIRSINDLMVGDIDSDGNRDLVAFSRTWSWQNSSYISTILGPISDSSTFLSTSVASPVVPDLLVDIDGDNLSEVVGQYWGLGLHYVGSWNEISEQWTEILQQETEWNFSYLKFGDVDGDGIIDLLGRKTKTSVFYQGNGDGAFATLATLVTGLTSDNWSYVAFIQFVDFDCDGIADVLFWEDAVFRIFLGEGIGTYTLTDTLSIHSYKYFRASYLLADISGDGFPDIIYDDVPGSPRDIRVFINDGTGHFPNPSVATGIGNSLEFAAGDLNGDAIPDLVVENAGQFLNVWWSNGDGTFVAGPEFSVSYYDKVAISDIDRDGDNDILAYGSQIKIYLNE